MALIRDTHHQHTHPPQRVERFDYWILGFFCVRARGLTGCEALADAGAEAERSGRRLFVRERRQLLRRHARTQMVSIRDTHEHTHTHTQMVSIRDTHEHAHTDGLN